MTGYSRRPWRSALLTPGSCLFPSVRSQSGTRPRVAYPWYGRLTGGLEPGFIPVRACPRSCIAIAAAAAAPRHVKWPRRPDDPANKCFATLCARRLQPPAVAPRCNAGAIRGLQVPLDSPSVVFDYDRYTVWLVNLNAREYTRFFASMNRDIDE